MGTADVGAVVCAFMFCDMFIAFRRRAKTFIEPFAINARTFEHARAVEKFDVVPCYGINRQILNGKSHFSQDVIQV